MVLYTTTDRSERERAYRWTVRGRAKVVHPDFGSIIVPHASKLTALMNAAEYWGVQWTDLRDAKVLDVGPDGGPTVVPVEYKKIRYEHL